MKGTDSLEPLQSAPCIATTVLYCSVQMGEAADPFFTRVESCRRVSSYRAVSCVRFVGRHLQQCAILDEVRLD